MNRSIAFAMFVAATLAGPGHAAVGGAGSTLHCSHSTETTGQPGYISCQGFEIGNVAAGSVNSAAFAGYGSFGFAGATNDSSGVFTNDPAGSQWGTLSFAQPQVGLFVLGLKGGPSYSLYLFDGGASGLSALAFDTFGITLGNGNGGPGLAHAALFRPAVGVVPEPGALAMMLAGLAGVGMIVRRRRR